MCAMISRRILRVKGLTDDVNSIASSMFTSVKCRKPSPLLRYHHAESDNIRKRVVATDESGKKHVGVDGESDGDVAKRTSNTPSDVCFEEHRRDQSRR